MPVVTGINTVFESLKSNRKVYRVFISREALSNKRIAKIRELALEKKVKVVVAPLAEIEKELGRLKQHVAAEVEEFKYFDFDELLDRGANSKAFCLIFLDGVVDPQNLGNIIRTSEFFGLGGVVIRKRRAAQVTAVVERISQGAASFIPVARVANICLSLKKAKEAGFTVLGAEADAELSINEVEIPEKCAFVAGGEDTGISRLVRENCDFLIRIPRYGKTTSLNVGSCLSILAYLWAAKFKEGEERIL